MSRTFMVGCALALLSSVNGSVAAEPLRARASGSAPGAEQSSSAMRRFVVLVDSATTKESVIPAILAAGRAELTAACESNSGAAVRIYNPMASGEYVDVSCAAVLGGEEVTGQKAEALTRAPGDEATGEAQQRLTPLGPLLCGLTSLITTTAQDRVCRSWRGRDSQFCNVGTFGSSAIWLLACSIAF